MLTALRGAGRGVLPRGRFARGVAVLAGSTVAAQGLVVLTSPVLTRMYTPADFGLLAGYVSVLVMFIAVASLRYDLAIPLPREDRTAADLLALALALALAASLAVGAVVWVFAEPVAALLRAPALRGYLWVLPLGLLGAATFQALSSWAVRRGAYDRIASTRVGQSVAQTAVQMGLGVLGAGPAGLLLGDVAGRASGSGTLGLLAWRRDRDTLRGVTLAGMRAAASRYRRFPLFASGSALLNAAGLQLPALLFAALYGPAVAGWFLLAQRVIGMPMTLVGQSIGQVYLGEAARAANQDPRALARLFSALSRRLLAYGGIPIVLVGVVGPAVFGPVFGPGWEVTGTYVLLLTPMFVGQFVVSPVSQVAAVMERQGLQLALDAFRTATVALAIFAPWALGWSHLRAVGCYSAGMLVTYTVFFVVYRRMVSAAAGPAPAGH